MNERPFYLQKMTDEFCQRQKANSTYSLRAYSRFLELDSSELSAILRSKRRLPLKKADKISRKLKLSPLEKAEFVRSLRRGKASLAGLAATDTFKYRELIENETNFRIIAEWEYFCVLSLMKTKTFRSDPKWIAKRLGVSELRAKNVIEHLISARLIERAEKGNYRLLHEEVKTTDDIASEALKSSHRESLSLAAKKLDEVAMSERDFSSVTLPVRRSDLPRAKELIREFRMKFEAYLSTCESDEVYQLSLQLFPLTRSQEVSP